LVIQRGGTILLTARSKAFLTEEGRAKAAEKLREAGIEGLVAIGGDGTFRGALKLIEEHRIPVVGVPGTIDNDLFGTDYTIGFDTAVNTALDAIDRIRDTAASHERIFFIEVMGRYAGFIALEVGIAGGAEIIALPEVPVSPQEIAETITDSFKKGKRSSIIVVAEGAYPGGAQALFKAVHGLTGFEARVLASRLGAAATRTLVEGTSGVMIGEVESEVTLTPLSEAVTKKKPIRLEFVDLARELAG